MSNVDKAAPSKFIPCPFCGSSNVHYYAEFQAKCKNCEATAGEFCINENEAALAWNNRVSPAEAENHLLREALKQISREINWLDRSNSLRCISDIVSRSLKQPLESTIADDSIHQANELTGSSIKFG
jgi:hypothetical protein